MSNGKDKRYKTVKILIDNQHVKVLSELFDTIPPSVVAADFGTNYTRFTDLVANPQKFRLAEVYKLAKLFDVDEVKMLNLVHAEYRKKRR